MRLFGNFLWLVLGGLLSSIAHFVLGIVLCITIIGIPFGIQCFKLARLHFGPFGKRVDLNYFSHPIMNTIWTLLFGWSLALPQLILGIALCITLIGIPFGLQVFKGMRLAVAPFGAKVLKRCRVTVYR